MKVPSPSTCIVFVGGEIEVGEVFSHSVDVLDVEQLAWATVELSGPAGTGWKARGWSSAVWSPAAPTEVFIFGGGSYNAFLNDLTVLELDTLESVPLRASEIGGDLGSLLDSGALSDLMLLTCVFVLLSCGCFFREQSKRVFSSLKLR